MYKRQTEQTMTIRIWTTDLNGQADESSLTAECTAYDEDHECVYYRGTIIDDNPTYKDVKDNWFVGRHVTINRPKF